MTNFGIDYDIVWDVVKTKIPDLRRQIQELLESPIDDKTL